MVIIKRINTAKYEKQNEKRIFIKVTGISLSKKNKTMLVKNKKIIPPIPLTINLSILCIISPINYMKRVNKKEENLNFSSSLNCFYQCKFISII